MTQQPIALIVDDQWNLAQNLKRYMRRHGYQCHVAGSVSEAKSILTATQAPDIALVDLNLPDSHGRELCVELRQVSPRTRIIVMSAQFDDQDKSLFQQLRVTSLLTKPFALSKILDRLDQQPSSNDATTETVNGCRLDHRAFNRETA